MQSPNTSIDRRLLWEKWHPLVLSAIAGSVAFFTDLANINGFRDLLQAAVNLSAITVGFLATSKSILFAIGNKEIVATMKTVGKWPMLIDYIMCAIYSAFFLAMASGALLLVDFRGPVYWHHFV